MPSLGAFTLPEDPVWTDEFDWTPVEQAMDYSLTGALILQTAVKQAGRPITLDVAWLTRAQVQAVVALADVADAEYTLTIAQGVYTVAFRRPPYAIAPLRQVSDPDAGEFYTVTLNLMTV